MNVETVFAAALAMLPCPVSQPPGDSTAESYVTFFEVQGVWGESASNTPTRLRHLVQLHAYSHLGDGTHRRLFLRAMKLLRAVGVRIESSGLDDYEKDTGIHHMAAYCEWVEPIDNEEEEAP